MKLCSSACYISNIFVQWMGFNRFSLLFYIFFRFHAYVHKNYVSLNNEKHKNCNFNQDSLFMIETDRTASTICLLLIKINE